MTEAEWLSNPFPPGLVLFVKGAVSDRKLRLLACACGRWSWGSVEPDERLRVVVETAERFADGEGTTEDLVTAYRPARRVYSEFVRSRPGELTPHHLTASADAASRSAFDAALFAALDAGWTHGGVRGPLSPPATAVGALARDVFGNPFRPVGVVPEWFAPPVVTLARTIYSERAFDRMPELADALERAGCADPDVLAHCRDGGPHVRGCWVIDMALGLA